jgi:hypothetical protein
MKTLLKTRALLVSVAAVSLLASACGDGGSTGASAPAPAARTSAGMLGMGDMSPEEMAAMDGPSSSALMICSDEIRSAVKRTFALTSPPSATRSWSANDFTFACTYRLPGGILRMSVQDDPDETTGRSHFRHLRARLAGASSIRGVQSLGFPAFETPGGDVVFLKDGKTLRVDASALSRSGLPTGFTRPEAAYGVAAAVIGCWTE